MDICGWTWWRHEMETFPALLAICAGNSPFPGEFPTQRPVTRNFDVFSDLRLNKRLSKQSWSWWFETLSCPLWRHRDDWNLLISHQQRQRFTMIHNAWCCSNAGSILSGPYVQVLIYSLHVPGWLLKWLDLITAHGSVTNEPGSVTWLATKYLKTVSWRNHTEKLTTFWPQNISFWPKINIPSSYFTILMLNCLENTLKLQFDSYVTAANS